MTDGFGAINWWGFSPAIDIQEKDVNVGLQDMKLSDSDSDELNCLMVGAGDCRHILKTLAQAHRHKKRKINFYVLESSLELYARDMLLLALALEPQQRVGLQDKTEMFLELFGNLNVRQQTMDYVERMSTLFIKMVTDFDFMAKVLPIFDMENLKYKERDMLEGIFKFWRNTDRNIIDLDKAWELRLRKYLDVRYDSIPNVFDWDYSMKLCEKGAGIIHTLHYTRWRHKGQAYEIREGTYDVNNKTLASGMLFKHEGERLARRGYWGDILVSPFIALGIEAEDESFFKKANNKYMKTSEDVAEYNVLSLLHELVNRCKYVPPQPSANEGPSTTKDQAEMPEAKLTEITEEDEAAEEDIDKETRAGETKPENKESSSEKINPLDKEYTSVPLDYTKIVFLPLNSTADLHKKSKFQKKFNFVYFSNSLVHHLTNKEMTETFADKATVILETAKFMIELKDEQTAEFTKKITSIALNAGCKVAVPCDPKEDCFAKFKFTRMSS